MLQSPHVTRNCRATQENTSPLRSEIPSRTISNCLWRGNPLLWRIYSILFTPGRNVKSKLTIEDDNITVGVKETDGCHRDETRQQHSVSVAYVVNGHPILSVNDDLAITILRIEATTLTIITTMLPLSWLLSLYSYY